MNTKTKTKPANYTAEQSAKIQADYTANPNKETVKALADEMGKSERSIVAKLVNLGIYKKAEKAETGEGKTETKGKLVSEIATLCEVTEDVFASLEGATKVALVALRDALKQPETEFNAE